MGIPGFFKWMKDKYPKVLQKKDYDIRPGDYDNLYLDMNGIIHPCCQPPDGNQYATDESEMLQKICAAVEHLFNVVRPAQLLYLAIDGVAPRAKLNQQRARRYESARARRSILEEDAALTGDASRDSVEQEMEAIRQTLDLGILGSSEDGEQSSEFGLMQDFSGFSGSGLHPSCLSSPTAILTSTRPAPDHCVPLLSWCLGLSPPEAQCLCGVGGAGVVLHALPA